ncbi:hypothetical protein HDU92_000881, partial [Lobulomyces angularis]
MSEQLKNNLLKDHNDKIFSLLVHNAYIVAIKGINEIFREKTSKIITGVNFGSNDITVVTAEIMRALKKEFNNDSLVLTPGTEINSISSNYDISNKIEDVYKSTPFDKNTFFNKIASMVSVDTNFNKEDEYFGSIKDNKLKFNDLYYVEKNVEKNSAAENMKVLVYCKNIKKVDAKKYALGVIKDDKYYYFTKSMSHKYFIDDEYKTKVDRITTLTQKNHSLLEYADDIINVFSSYIDNHMVNSDK